MLITYDAEQKKKLILIFFVLPPTYCECDKYDSNSNVHKIISVTLWLELRTFHFKWEVNEVQILFVISIFILERKTIILGLCSLRRCLFS
jgi:hypothetical protein